MEGGEGGAERETSVPAGARVPPVINRILPAAAHPLNKGRLGQSSPWPK
jgi:hypothetical protein